MPKSAAAKISPMSETHIPSVVEIERASNPSPWSENSLRSELQNPQARYFVASTGGQIVGFCGYWRVIDEAHITNVAVAPSSRNQGIGRQLVCAALEDAAAAGLRCATLEVRAGNTPAISLYEKLGFAKCAVRKAYYPSNREDAIVMWLYNLKSH